MSVFKQTKLDDYLDIETFVERYPQISVNQLRWIVVQRRRYNLESAIKKLGKKLYFHVPSIIEHLESYSSRLQAFKKKKAKSKKKTKSKKTK